MSVIVMDNTNNSVIEYPPMVNASTNVISSIYPILTNPQADFHCHLRQDDMMDFVTPMIRDGGYDLVYVMPNLLPPIKTVAAAAEYHDKLSALAPDVEFLMTLYLHPGMNVQTIAQAASSGIIHGVRYRRRPPYISQSLADKRLSFVKYR